MHACSVVSSSLWIHGLQPTRLLCPWDSPGRNTRVGCHFLLQGIFPIRDWTCVSYILLHWQAGSLPLSDLESSNYYLIIINNTVLHMWKLLRGKKWICIYTYSIYGNRKKYVKAVCCHAAYLTYMQSTSRETLAWKKHKLESRLLGDISIPQICRWHHPYGRKERSRATYWKWKRRVKKLA